MTDTGLDATDTGLDATDTGLDVTEMKVCETEFSSLDGLLLSGTHVFPPEAEHTAVLVYGGGVARDERELFTRLALGLADAGVASLRFDLRAHGASEGRQEGLTLSGLVNDIRAAVDLVRCNTDGAAVSLVGTSLWAGASVLFAARHPELIRRLVLLNPVIDYKKRFIDDKSYWTDDRITEEAGRELATQGFIPHSRSLRLGRPLLNEVFHLRPDEALGRVVTPTLIVHGTADTFVPIGSSRMHVGRIIAEARLLEVEGAPHGFVAHGDPQHRDPSTQRWQELVVRSVAEWITGR